MKCVTLSFPSMFLQQLFPCLYKMSSWSQHSSQRTAVSSTKTTATTAQQVPLIGNLINIISKDTGDQILSCTGAVQADEGTENISGFAQPMESFGADAA